ncbi:unnamed protein product, partial [marine sediment metagenome]
HFCPDHLTDELKKILVQTLPVRKANKIDS